VAGEAAELFGTPGATGVWAPENTREAIFDGIKSREVFGTSGPLIRVRFFGGWEFSDDLVKDKDFVKKAYAGGVPMGQDLPKKTSKAPTFAVWALKDPDSESGQGADHQGLVRQTRLRVPENLRGGLVRQS
jgi:hypothetical protein